MSTPNTTSPIGPFEMQAVRRKVRRIIGRAGFTRQDRPDLEQELLLRLLQSLPLFDASRGRREAFIVAVVDRDASNLVRDAMARKRDRRGVGSLSAEVATPGGAPAELGATLVDGANHGHRQTEPRSHEELDRLRQDVAEVLDTLTVPERILAVRLMTQSISDIAWEMGAPRTTVQTHVDRLRQKLRGTGLGEYLKR